MNRKAYIKILNCLLTIITINQNAFGQSVDDVDGDITQQIWVDLYPHFILTEKLQYTGDIGFRKIVDENSWARLFLRPSIKYQMSELFSIQGSINVSYDWSKYTDDFLLITPRQGIRLDWPSFVRFSFYHLFRIEERFSYNTSDWSHSVNVRARYLIHGTFDFKLNKSENFWFIPFYAELFKILNEEEEIMRNQSRSGIGVGFDPSNGWQYTLLLNWQRSRVAGQDTQISDFIYQIKVKKTLSKWSQK